MNATKKTKSAPAIDADATLTRRHFIKSVGQSLLLTACAPSALPAQAKSGDMSLRIGYLPITDATPLLIAHAKGFFKDEGLDVPRPIPVRNWSALVESFLSGKFNLTHFLFPIPIWMRYKNRMPIKVMAWDHTNGSALTVHRDDGIRNFSDLGGRRIAVPHWYSMHNIILQLGLRKAQLTPVIRNHSVPLSSSEVNLFILPPPEMPAALAGKKIDGFIVAEPYNALAEIRLKAHILRFTGDIWQNHPCCVVVARDPLTAGQQIRAQKAINAIVRAQLWITGNRSKTATILSRDGDNYLPLPENVLQRVFNGYAASDYDGTKSPHAIRHPDWPVHRIDFQPYPFPSATRTIFNTLKDTLMEGDTGFLKQLDAEFVARDLVDTRWVKKAVRMVGGLEKFYKQSAPANWERHETIAL